jgi:hypothetical protein
VLPAWGRPAARAAGALEARSRAKARAALFEAHHKSWRARNDEFAGEFGGRTLAAGGNPPFKALVGMGGGADGFGGFGMGPGALPAAADATCDDRDDDCDGRVDEDAPAAPTRCGVGACEGAPVGSSVG